MAAKVLGFAHKHIDHQLHIPSIFPFPLPKSTESFVKVKPWGHDCREHRSWRCVWCEARFCFDCDTGTTAPLDLFTNHRLCQKHYSELPGQSPSAVYKLHASQSGTTRPFSIDLKYIPQRLSSLKETIHQVRKGDEDKLRCSCLMSKTLLCRECVPKAQAWKFETEKLYNEDGTITCALGRFPGNCPSFDSGGPCSCNGKGIGCNYIEEQEWKKMETDDLLWLGRFGAAKGDFKTKEKKNLRRLFGESFPKQIEEESTDDDEERQEQKVEPKTKSAIMGILKSNASLVSKRSFSSLKSLNVESNMTITHTREPKIHFLSNPQFRKPYSNFQIPRETRKPSISESESFLDSASDDGFDDEVSSIASVSSTSDHDYTFETKYEGLSAPPPITQVATATVVLRQEPRIVHTKSTSDLRKKPANKLEALPCVNLSATTDRKDVQIADRTAKKEKQSKWGCQEKVFISQEALQTREAHGFWRCSFCNGRIRGV